MLGRTYAIGYEPDLQEVLLERPRRTVLNPDWRWAVWYPLRRSGRFAQLPPEEQRVILAEHGTIGMSFGAGDYAHDIRLACHGLDKDDNDFVIGLIGKELFPLSAIVQTMRKHAADVALSRASRSVLRRPGRLAERPLASDTVHEGRSHEDHEDRFTKELRVLVSSMSSRLEALGRALCDGGADAASGLGRSQARLGRCLVTLLAATNASMSAAGRAPVVRRHLPATREHRHRRNRADAEALSEIAERVGVDLDDQELSGRTCGDLRELRRDHAARAAPRRPVVDDDRHGRRRRSADRNPRDEATSSGADVAGQLGLALAAADGSPSRA